MEQFKDYIVYGPYRGKDGRDRVILYKNRKRRTMSYPKFLWWKEKGELIKDNEQIHHDDENVQNNKIDNFIKTNKHDHMSFHINPPEKVKCRWCEKEFILMKGSLSNRRTNEKRGKDGPFCSRQCSGKHGTYVQYVVKGMKGHGGRKPYRLKKLAMKLHQMRQNNAP